MNTKAEIKLTYNWNQDRRTLGQLVMDKARNNKEAAKKFLNERLEPVDIYEEALIKQVAKDIDGVPNMKFVKVDTTDAISALFDIIFGK